MLNVGLSEWYMPDIRVDRAVGSMTIETFGRYVRKRGPSWIRPDMLLCVGIADHRTVHRDRRPHWPFCRYARAMVSTVVMVRMEETCFRLSAIYHFLDGMRTNPWTIPYLNLSYIAGATAMFLFATHFVVPVSFGAGPIEPKVCVTITSCN